MTSGFFALSDAAVKRLCAKREESRAKRKAKLLARKAEAEAARKAESQRAKIGRRGGLMAGLTRTAEQYAALSKAGVEARRAKALAAQQAKGGVSG